MEIALYFRQVNLCIHEKNWKIITYKTIHTIKLGEKLRCENTSNIL